MTKERPSWAEYVQPAMMASASAASAVASVFAIIVGADKTPEGKTNPFFYLALSNSCMYTCANTYKCYQIFRERSFVDTEEQRRLEGEKIGLLEVV